jgi:hypothetical protein
MDIYFHCSWMYMLRIWIYVSYVNSTFKAGTWEALSAKWKQIKKAMTYIYTEIYICFHVDILLFATEHPGLIVHYPKPILRAHMKKYHHNQKMLITDNFYIYLCIILQH